MDIEPIDFMVNISNIMNQKLILGVIGSKPITTFKYMCTQHVILHRY